ncbi:hypothetical protein CLOP_g6489 [Closterium sp. NIES-67]|nr:hypothetical protein CLOP_g6489 [Closterium sp. NIES-67]
MTAPVLTHTAGAAGGGSEEKKSGSGERIAMTAPVLTHTAGAAAAGGDSNTVTAAAGEKIAMTAPVVTASTAASTPGKTTMQFLLPAASPRPARPSHQPSCASASAAASPPGCRYFLWPHNTLRARAQVPGAEERA